MILLRTTEVGCATLDLADTLGAASGLLVILLVDERDGPVDTGGRPKLGLDRDAYAALGLHVGRDVGWRCGDYGFYLARRAYPAVKHFWMIEFDVRLTGNARAFFDLVAAREDLDLVVSKLQPADAGWFWRPHLAASDAKPWRCFFPVLRLSARAIDVLYDKRRAHSRILSRIALWPNDEAFVATTIVNAGLTHADLNALGLRLYDDATFSYDNVVNGDDIALRTGSPELLHPVLTGEARLRKLSRLASSHHYPDLPLLGIRRRIAPRINRLRAW